MDYPIQGVYGANFISKNAERKKDYCWAKVYEQNYVVPKVLSYQVQQLQVASDWVKVWGVGKPVFNIPSYPFACSKKPFSTGRLFPEL